MTTIIVTIIPIMLLVPTVSPPIFLLAYTRLSYSLPHSRQLRFSSVGFKQERPVARTPSS